MQDKLKALRQKALALPQTPGVYLMKNSAGKIIYIGKAKALKNRVSQYFNNQEHWVKVQKMVEQAADFDTILTDSEFEALVLECSLIKQHRPRYNILLKDDKGYRYIRVTKGPWRNFYAVKRKAEDDAEYIGPYTSAFVVNHSVDEAKKIFRIPQCAKVFPRDFGESRPCLHYFIGQCAAPCAGKIGQAEYEQNLRDALGFLRGGEKAALKELERRMEAASENLEFEAAARLRDSIKALERLKEKQKVVSVTHKEQDVFALVCDSQTDMACLAVLRFSQGRLRDGETFLIERPENLPEARRELLQRYYSLREDVPRRVTWDGPVDEADLLELWLCEKAGKKVKLDLPEQGEQRQLIEMCRANAAQQLSQHTGKSGKTTAALDELASLLGLSAPPAYIEAYDVSHTAGSQNVAGMVVFFNGTPCKRCYKRFTVKTVSGQDDYASLVEVLTRRFAHWEKEQGAQEGFGRLPDLILLDGGLGQVHAVLPVLEQFGLKIPLFGMVKDSRHRTRAIAADGGEIALSSKRQAFTLVAEIQNETHRWAITFHRQQRKGATLSSSLTSIEGIGEKRARALLRHFKTLQAIRAADLESLAAVSGMSRPAAQAVYDVFHN